MSFGRSRRGRRFGCLMYWQNRNLSKSKGDYPRGILRFGPGFTPIVALAMDSTRFDLAFRSQVIL
jgi:hypothetical protein